MVSLGRYRQEAGPLHPHINRFRISGVQAVQDNKARVQQLWHKVY